MILAKPPWRRKLKYNENENKNLGNDYIFGRNPVIEALKSGRNISSILISSNEVIGSLKVILALAKEKNIVIKRVKKQSLDLLCRAENHQGVVALVSAKKTCSVDEILNFAKSKGEAPFLIIADGIEDPHNLGAIIRTAECAGAHGVIISERRSAGLTGIVQKSSAGALEYVMIAKVKNLSFAVDYIKDKGIWVYAADMGGALWKDQDLTGPLALVIGSEGFGISKLIKKKCDFTVSLPMNGKINSLNASVAAGVLMYEIRRQRMDKN